MFPEPPEWMGENGKRAWNAMASILTESLESIDQFALEATCGHYDAMINALKDLQLRGPLIESYDKNGNEILVKNPAAQIARDNSLAFKAWCSEFGLTPRARKSLAMKLNDDAHEVDLIT